VQLNSEVQRISINRNGSALFLVGLDCLYVMYLYGRTSTKENTIICRYNFLILVLYGYVFFGLQCVSNNSVIVICNYLSFEMSFSFIFGVRKHHMYLTSPMHFCSWLPGGNYEFSGSYLKPSFHFLKKFNFVCSICF